MERLTGALCGFSFKGDEGFRLSVRPPLFPQIFIAILHFGEKDMAPQSLLFCEGPVIGWISGGQTVENPLGAFSPSRLGVGFY